MNVRQFLPRIDVPAFVDLVVERHRIGPVVYANLKKLPVRDLPPGLLTPLAIEARGNAVKALQALRSHVLVNRWFGEAGIPWLAFKGITLAQQCYGDFSLRQVNDQDLWIPADRLEDVRALLGQHGFAWNPFETGWDAAARGPRHRDFLMRYNIQEQHLSAELGRIEVHWELTEAPAFFDVPVPVLLERGERLQVAGVDLCVMSRVDLLLYLCDHGGRHAWGRLKWLADLPQLLEAEPLDWDVVFARAQVMGCAPSLFLGLALARDLFDWHPPSDVARRLDGHTVPRVLFKAVRTELLQETQPGCVAGPPGLRTVWRLHWSRLMMGNLRAAGGLLWRLSLSPNDLHAASFPDRLFFMYRLVRPFLFGIRRILKVKKALQPGS